MVAFCWIAEKIRCVEEMSAGNLPSVRIIPANSPLLRKCLLEGQKTTLDADKVNVSAAVIPEDVTTSEASSSSSSSGEEPPAKKRRCKDNKSAVIPKDEADASTIANWSVEGRKSSAVSAESLEICTKCGDLVLRGGVGAHHAVCRGGSKKLKGRRLCKSCRTTVSRQKLRKHQELCRGVSKTSMCGCCGVAYLDRNRTRHTKVCRKAAVIACGRCGSVFSCKNFSSFSPRTLVFSCLDCSKEAAVSLESGSECAEWLKANARGFARLYRREASGTLYYYCSGVRRAACPFRFRMTRSPAGHFAFTGRLDHNHEIAQLRPRRVIRNETQRMWRAAVVRQLREGKSNNDILSDMQLFSRQRLSEMRYASVKKAWRHHVDDRRSLKGEYESGCWGLQRHEVLLFKDARRLHVAHKALSYDDFALGFMTDAQVGVWEAYAWRAVCIDVTSRMTKHRMKLISVLVLGPKGAIPAATLITNHETEAVLGAFFRQIRERVSAPHATYEYFLSDDNVAYCNAFEKVFGGAKQLLLAFKVKQAWRRELEGTGHSAFVVEEVMEEAEALMTSRSTYEEARATIDLNHTIARLQLDGFADFLRTEFLSRKDLWMLRHRTSEARAMDSFCEAFHERLMRELKGRRVLRARADRLVVICTAFIQRCMEEGTCERIAIEEEEAVPEAGLDDVMKKLAGADQLALKEQLAGLLALVNKSAKK